MLRSVVQPFLLFFNQEVVMESFPLVRERFYPAWVMALAAAAVFGRLLLDGTVDSLRAAAEQKRVMRARIGQGAWTLPEGAELLDRTGDEIALRFDPERVPADRLVLHLAESCGLMDVQISQPPLEETVAALYRKLEGAEA